MVNVIKIVWSQSRTSEHNFSVAKYVQNHPRFGHMENDSSKKFRVITKMKTIKNIMLGIFSRVLIYTTCTDLHANMTVCTSETVQLDTEPDVTAGNHVLDFKIHKLYIEAEFLNNPGKFTGGDFRVLFGLSSVANHFSR